MPTCALPVPGIGHHCRPRHPGTFVLETLLLPSLTPCPDLSEPHREGADSCCTCPASKHPSRVAAVQSSLGKFGNDLSPTLVHVVWPEDGTCLPQTGAREGGIWPGVVQPSTLGLRLLVCRVPGREQGRLNHSRPCPDDTGPRGNGEPSSSFKI